MPYARRRAADILDSSPPDGANATSYTVSLENGTEYTDSGCVRCEDGGGIERRDHDANGDGAGRAHGPHGGGESR